MPESLTMPACSPAPAPAAAGTPGGSGATDAGAFEDLLQAGLAGHRDSDAGVPATAAPAGAKSAAKSADKLAAGARGKIQIPQPAKGEDCASDSLAALLAYSAGGTAPDVPAPAGSPDGATDAAPAVATPPADAATPAPALAPPGLVQALVPTVLPTAPATGSDAGTDSSGSPITGAPITGTAPGSASAKAANEPAGSDAGAARATVADTPGTLRALPGLAETAKDAAGARTDAHADARTDRRTEIRADGERRPEPRVEPGDSAVAHAARLQEDLSGLVQAAREGRPAERSADTAARPDGMGAMVRTDMMPRLDPASAAGPERTLHVVHVEHELGSPGWKQEFGSQVTVLVSRREPQAEIRINPPQLGPVEVRIGLQGDQLSLAFTAQHPDTRAAIENALPQLRETFAESGIALGNTSVNADSSQQHTPRGAHPGPVSFRSAEPIIADALPAIQRAAVRLVDTFA